MSKENKFKSQLNKQEIRRQKRHGCSLNLEKGAINGDPFPLLDFTKSPGGWLFALVYLASIVRPIDTRTIPNSSGKDDTSPNLNTASNDLNRSNQRNVTLSGQEKPNCLSVLNPGGNNTDLVLKVNGVIKGLEKSPGKKGCIFPVPNQDKPNTKLAKFKKDGVTKYSVFFKGENELKKESGASVSTLTKGCPLVEGEGAGWVTTEEVNTIKSQKPGGIINALAKMMGFGTPDAYLRQDIEATADNTIPNEGVLGTCQHASTYLVGVPYIQGTPIATLLPELKNQLLDEKFSIARNAMLSLTAMHTDGIVHFDIHSENCLRTPEGKIAFIDYDGAINLKKGAEQPNYKYHTLVGVKQILPNFKANAKLFDVLHTLLFVIFPLFREEEIGSNLPLSTLFSNAEEIYEARNNPALLSIHLKDFALKLSDANFVYEELDRIQKEGPQYGLHQFGY